MKQESTREELLQKIDELKAELDAARKETDDLRLNRSYLYAILNNTDVPIYLKTADYKYILVNKVYERLARVTSQQISGKTDFEIFPEPVAQLFREQDETVMADRSLKIFEETVPLPDGVFTYLTSKFPVCDKNGVPYAVGGVCTDITKLKATEEELRISEERFRNIIESCPLGVIHFRLETDNRLVFQGANLAADIILDADCTQYVGKTLEEAFPSMANTELPAKVREVLETGQKWHSARLEYGQDDQPAYAEIHAFRTAPNTVATFFSDITEREYTEAEVHKMQKLESIGILAGGIAHDFNNLLTAILGNISLAEIYPEESEKLMERLAGARKAALRAQDLTRQLLTFSKGGEPVKTTIDLKEVIKESSSFALSGSQTGCVIELEANLWPVDADEGQINQVIQNIVRNGDQAMPDGGRLTILAQNVSLDEHCSLPLQGENYVEISITDTGVGILEEHLSKVFDPYFTTKQKGSGLGLASSFSIIKNHGGTISVKSKTGKGTTFKVHLPASRTAPLQKKAESDHPLPADKNILIMDDDIAILSVAQEMLEFFNHRVATAKDGAQAVSLYRDALENHTPFDAVLLDLTIPGGMGGLDTLAQLREIDPTVKAIVCSGYANNPVMSDHERYGFKGVIAKPYDIDKISSTISKLID